MPKTYDNIKLDFFHCRADTVFCFKSNMFRKAKNLSPNFKQLA